MSHFQVNEAFLQRFKVVRPSCPGFKFVVMYPTPEGQGKLKLFPTKEEAETFKQQKIADYLAPPPKPKPLPTPTVDVTRFCAKLSNTISKSLKAVEFFKAYHRTKGKDLSGFIERYVNRLNADTEWVTTWADIWVKYVNEKNGFNMIVRECNKINKARAKAEAKQVREQAKAEVKEAKARAKAKAKAKAKSTKTTKQTKQDSESSSRTPTVSTTAPLPTITGSISELDQLSQQMDQDCKQLNLRISTEAKGISLVHRFVMQELASASRSRDYINHLESKVSRESDCVEQLLLKENLKQLSEIQANMSREAWTVTTRIDMIMLNKWLDEASKYQAEVMTNTRAIAPEPIQLTTDACFPTPMLSMGSKTSYGSKNVEGDFSRSP